MEEAEAAENGGYRMVERVPLVRRDGAGEWSISLHNPHAASELAHRETKDCTGANANLCEKPVGTSQSMAVAIAVSIVVPVVVLAIILLWLHRRNVKKQRKEDQDDPHKSLDFGLGEHSGGSGRAGQGKRKSAFFGGAEKSGNPHNRQISMDMNLSSPYLLPPGLQGSRESLHSLARTLHQNEDPYRPVTNYPGSDAASMRSYRKPGREGSSVHTGSSGGKESGVYPRTTPPTPTAAVRPLRKGSLPASPTSPVESVPPRYEASQAEIVSPPPALPPKGSVSGQAYPAASHIDAIPYPDEKPGGQSAIFPVPEIQEPPPAASKIGRKGLPSNPKLGSSPTLGSQPPPRAHQAEIEYARNSLAFNFSQEPLNVGLYEPEPASLATASPRLSPLATSALPSGPHPHTNNSQAADLSSVQDQNQTMAAAPFPSPIIEESQEYHNDYYENMHPGPEDQHANEERGRAQHRRQSSEYPQDAFPMGLNVPQQNSKRLSVGFRPLPPDEFMDTEDPETRANRIRSFYKEYFDESKQHQQDGGAHYQQGYHQGYDQGHSQGGHSGYPSQQGGGQSQYYEDYDSGYLGEAAYYDPDSNAFVMPYAQPVARRAMTPPPSGSRFPGPRGAPRNYHGSIGGMSMPGGMRGPPRPGSSVSNNRWGPGPRPGSSASGQWGRQRAGSAMSGRPRKPMPPPTALTTLPNPSKLRDDSFALMNALDFAPPSVFKDQVAGRPQSPGGGERRPYVQPHVANSPLVSAFEEMSALPSPHLLRKSSTFTGLDFAPPRKFKDADTMSDAGSIRSNRSGISAVQLGAIRSGAGRVSRLPGDTVFTQAAMSDTLKPKWGMRGM